MRTERDADHRNLHRRAQTAAELRAQSRRAAAIGRAGAGGLAGFDTGSRALATCVGALQHATECHHRGRGDRARSSRDERCSGAAREIRQTQPDALECLWPPGERGREAKAQQALAKAALPHERQVAAGRRPRLEDADDVRAAVDHVRRAQEGGEVAIPTSAGARATLAPTVEPLAAERELAVLQWSANSAHHRRTKEWMLKS